MYQILMLDELELIVPTIQFQLNSNYSYNMPEETIVFIVQNQECPVSKSDFFPLTKLADQKRSIRRSVLPEWVTLPLFNKIKHFIETQDLSMIDTSNTDELQKLLWLGDLLYMQGFQERLIQEKILNIMSPTNCVMFLIESHKKLRNSDKSLTCWYNLLNTSMSYIAGNMLVLYPKIKQSMKKLNEKILSEILERTVKNMRKNHYEHKEQIFRIIMEIKGTEDIGKLCQDLKEVVKKKKINPQIHANLSWKLKDLINIDLKKTKVFKFIDYEWKLQALSSIQNGKKQLNISLILESAREGSQKSSSHSENVDDFQLKGDTLSGFNQNKQEAFGSNDFQRLGVLYLKLVSKIEENTYETDVRVNYLNIQQKESIQLLEFNQSQLQELGQKRIEITLYCSLENVYTFLLNYLLENYSFTTLNLQHFCFEELALITRFLIKDGKQADALHIIMHLLHSRKSNQYQTRSLVLALDYRSMPKKVLTSVSDLLKLVGFNKLNEQLMAPFQNQPHRLSQSPLPPSVPSSSIVKTGFNPQQPHMLERAITQQKLKINQNKIPLESNSQADIAMLKNRGDSKQRLKKIFESPKRKGPLTLQEQRQQEKMRIQQELDIRRYIYHQDSAFCKAFNDAPRGF